MGRAGPAYWVQYGYAVVNADPSGVGKSEGDIYALGSQEGRDGAQEWCNGKVGLSSNSWLAVTQVGDAMIHEQYICADRFSGL